MKHLLNEFFDLSNLLQILNDHRMVDVELFGNLVFLPGESQGQRSMVGCCLWGCRVGHDWSNLAAAAACSCKRIIFDDNSQLSFSTSNSWPLCSSSSRLLSASINLQLIEPPLWKILKEMGITDYLTCLLRNLYAGQEATVRTGHGTTDWFQIGKGVCQGCILSPAYLTYMQSTSWKTLDWKKHKLESRLPG